jgi:hypothetical protein
MAGASRRGYGEDGIYFDHRADCRDSNHKTCSGRWRGVVSLGFDADGKRIRRKVSGQTRTEAKDKLKALHSELDAGLRTGAPPGGGGGVRTLIGGTSPPRRRPARRHRTLSVRRLTPWRGRSKVGLLRWIALVVPGRSSMASMGGTF